MKVFGHGDGYAEGQGIGGVAVAAKDEIAGDSALRDAERGAGGAGEDDRSWDVADGGLREDGLGEDTEICAVDFDLAAGHRGGWDDAVDAGTGRELDWGAGFVGSAAFSGLRRFVGLQEREERLHSA